MYGFGSRRPGAGSGSGAMGDEVVSDGEVEDSYAIIGGAGMGMGMGVSVGVGDESSGSSGEGGPFGPGGGGKRKR